MSRVFLSSIFVLLFVVGSGCSLMSKRSVPDAAAKKDALDDAASELSLQQLDQAYLVFRVAFDKSLESWQGPSDDVVSGCRINGKDAESGLGILKTWLDRRAAEEARKIEESPRSYQLPIAVDTCESDCSCGLGLKILEAAKLDDQSHSKVKDLKRVRIKLEAKSELLTSERAELCAESATWICKSNLLKALKPTK